MYLPPLDDATRQARLEALGLVRAMLRDDDDAFQVLLPDDLLGFQRSYQALLGLLATVFHYAEDPEHILDQLTDELLAHPAADRPANG